MNCFLEKSYLPEEGNSKILAGENALYLEFTDDGGDARVVGWLP